MTLCRAEANPHRDILWMRNRAFYCYCKLLGFRRSFVITAQSIVPDWYKEITSLIVSICPPCSRKQMLLWANSWFIGLICHIRLWTQWRLMTVKQGFQVNGGISNIQHFAYWETIWTWQWLEQESGLSKDISGALTGLCWSFWASWIMRLKGVNQGTVTAGLCQDTETSGMFGLQVLPQCNNSIWNWHSRRKSPGSSRRWKH